MLNEHKHAVGSLRISREVIATIASVAAREVEGVYGLAPFTANIRGWLLKKQTAKPVAIDLNDEIAVIDMHVILQYGANIPTVCEKVQEAVKESVQSMTGIAVSKVNIVVAGINFGTEQPPQPADASKD